MYGRNQQLIGSTSHLSHQDLVNYIQKLDLDVNKEGVCFGVTMMAIQALLANDIKSFNIRLGYLSDIPLEFFSSTINAAKLRVIKANQNNEDQKVQDELLFNIPIFFENVLIYQQLHRYAHLFPRGMDLRIQDAIVSSLLTMPVTLGSDMNEPNLCIADSFSGFYSLDEIVSLFESLRETIQLLKIRGIYLDKSLTLLLDNTIHAVGLGYDSSIDAWHYIDVNYLPLRLIPHEEVVLLASNVCRSFFCDKTVAFSTHIYALQKDAVTIKQIVLCWHQCYMWKKIHLPTEVRLRSIDKNQFSWLLAAVTSGQVDTARAILEIMKTPNLEQPKDGSSLLLQATIWRHTECIATLLKAGAIVDKARPRDLMTPLFLAAHYGYMAAILLLLENGGDVNFRTKYKASTPFIIAVQQGHYDVVKLMLKYGADVSLTLRDIEITPVYLAARGGHANILKLLIAHGAEFNLPIKGQGDTPLYAAIEHGQLETTKILLDAGADPNKYHLSRDTMLMVAVKHGYYDIVKLLLETDSVQLRLRGNRLSYLANIARRRGFDKIDELINAKVNLQLYFVGNECENPILFQGISNDLEKPAFDQPMQLRIGS